MLYDTGTMVIAAPTTQAAQDAMLQYGVYNEAYPADDQVTVIPTILVVTSYAEAVATISELASDTPWTCLPDVQPSLFSYMYNRFGAAVRMSEAIRALNDEYAINPKLLRG